MKIYQNTVDDLLWEVLSTLMTLEVIRPFRLVGGTSLSLLLGHRKSVDIDLFTDVGYGSLDFEEIDTQLINTFPSVQMSYAGNKGMGKNYFIGKSKEEAVKVDLYYTDAFIRPEIRFENIRLSQVEDIAAMKLEVVGNTGRKKDFWDLHELMEHFSISQMLDFYQERYPYNHSREELLRKLTDFSKANHDFDPLCLKSKYWELIRLDMEEAVREVR